MTEEEEFFAWLDGELDEDAAARIAARVAADPALTEQARAHHALGKGLRAAFDPLMAAPVPERVAAPPIDFLASRDRRSSRRFGIPQWAAMAATLALGIGLGTLAGDRGGQTPVTIEDGQMIAAAALEKALDSQLASAGEPRGATRIGLSFRDRNNLLCRSFESEAAGGLACRDGEEWRIDALYGAEATAGDYRMAAGSDPRLATLIDSVIAGEPLDATEERAAMANGWR